MKKQFYLLALLIFMIEGCAGVDIIRITPANTNEKGIRYYRPYPYLLVTRVKGGDSMECRIIYLPNKNEEYAINIKSGLGTVKTDFTLEEGWKLTGYGETRDSKTADILTAFIGLLKEAGVKYKITREGKEKEEELGPGLYVFIFDDNTGLITDLKPVVQFK